jgi:hypothetical protein
MIGDKCAVRHCQEIARWTVTISEHPNAAKTVARYCTHHASRLALWENCPVPYTVTVEGPT